MCKDISQTQNGMIPFRYEFPKHCAEYNIIIPGAQGTLIFKEQG